MDTLRYTDLLPDIRRAVDLANVTRETLAERRKALIADVFNFSLTTPSGDDLIDGFISMPRSDILHVKAEGAVAIDGLVVRRLLASGRDRLHLVVYYDGGGTGWVDIEAQTEDPRLVEEGRKLLFASALVDLLENTGENHETR